MGAGAGGISSETGMGPGAGGVGVGMEGITPEHFPAPSRLPITSKGPWGTLEKYFTDNEEVAKHFLGFDPNDTKALHGKVAEIVNQLRDEWISEHPGATKDQWEAAMRKLPKGKSWMNIAFNADANTVDFELNIPEVRAGIGIRPSGRGGAGWSMIDRSPTGGSVETQTPLELPLEETGGGARAAEILSQNEAAAVKKFNLSPADYNAIKDESAYTLKENFLSKEQIDYVREHVGLERVPYARGYHGAETLELHRQIGEAIRSSGLSNETLRRMSVGQVLRMLGDKLQKL